MVSMEFTVRHLHTQTGIHFPTSSGPTDQNPVGSYIKLSEHIIGHYRMDQIWLERAITIKAQVKVILLHKDSRGRSG